MKTNDGRLVVISGASRSGKTAYVRKVTKGEKRIIAYDPEDQWAQLPGWTRITRREDLYRVAHRRGPVRAGFVAAGDLKRAFDFWAGCIFNAGRYYEPITAIAEEIADVTTPSKAPGYWGMLVRRGLKRGITIYAISQRWSEADKTAFGNASEFVMFRQSSGDDVRYLARKTRVPESEIEGLMPLEYVKYSAVGEGTVRGKLKF